MFNQKNSHFSSEERWWYFFGRKRLFYFIVISEKSNINKKMSRICKPEFLKAALVCNFPSFLLHFCVNFSAVAFKFGFCLVPKRLLNFGVCLNFVAGQFGTRVLRFRGCSFFAEVV